MSVAALDNGLIAALKADAQLTALAPGGVYRDIAPDGVAEPFVIVTLMSHHDVPQFGATEAYQEARYLVKAVGKGTSPTSTESAADRIHAVLQNATLTMSGFSQMGCFREERISYVEADAPSRYQHRGGIYVVRACPL